MSLMKTLEAFIADNPGLTSRFGFDAVSAVTPLNLFSVLFAGFTITTLQLACWMATSTATTPLTPEMAITGETVLATRP
ncbi:hypothetical protein [Lelliottia sp.]|uniref:hypothetical protein n=1 Tax=Lelliottia sp. TaxID=1898429 RepID=UPI00388E6277